MCFSVFEKMLKAILANVRTAKLIRCRNVQTNDQPKDNSLGVINKYQQSDMVKLEVIIWQ